MKRDIKLIRKILLAIEEKDNNDGQFLNQEALELMDVPINVFDYHIARMNEAGWMRISSQNADNKTFYWDIKMTNAGHEFLDNIRNEKILNGVLEAVEKLAETASFAIIAILVDRAMKQAMGLP